MDLSFQGAQNIAYLVTCAARLRLRQCDWPAHLQRAPLCANAIAEHDDERNQPLFRSSGELTSHQGPGRGHCLHARRRCSIFTVEHQYHCAGTTSAAASLADERFPPWCWTTPAGCHFVRTAQRSVPLCQNGILCHTVLEVTPKQQTPRTANHHRHPRILHCENRWEVRLYMVSVRSSV